MTAASFNRFIGREVIVYGTEVDEDGEHRQILTGRLVAVEEDCLALADDEFPNEEVVALVDLSLVAVVKLWLNAEKPLQVVDGGKAGKVRRLKVEEPQQPA